MCKSAKFNKDELSSFINKVIENCRLKCKDKNYGEDILQKIEQQLAEFIEQSNSPEIQKLFELNWEVYSLLNPVFRKNEPGDIPRFIVPVKMDSWKSCYQLLKKDWTGSHFTLLNQPAPERGQVWCWSHLGHQFGHNLFNAVNGLKEFMQNKLEQIFQEEYLDIFNRAFPDGKLFTRNISGKIKAAVDLKEEAKHTFTEILNRLNLNEKLSIEIPDTEAAILIHFLKYRWLHWLENCFADIIGILIFDAASVISAVHSYKFFTREIANLDGADQISTKQELIDWFLGYRGEYPVYFRFLFMTEALFYIEDSLDRKYRFGKRLQDRFSPIIDILLDLMMIREQQRKTYRYQHLTIDIKLENTMVRYMVPEFFKWISEFLKKDEHEWLPKCSWDNSKLEEMDNIVYSLLNEDALPADIKPSQEVVAARFAYELFPRRLEEINNKVLQVPGKTGHEKHTDELIYLDYYFNRERYLEWSVYSKDVSKLKDQLGDEYSDLKEKLGNMPSLYKEDRSYEDIMIQLENILVQNSVGSNVARKIKMFINHYYIYKEIRILFAQMEKNLKDKYYKKAYGDKALVTILEEDNFNRVLNLLLESNTINTDALDVIHDTLFKFANKQPTYFAGQLYENMTENGKKTYGNPVSYFRLYKEGELYNEKGYFTALKNWFDNFGETRIVHREARKGRIKGMILKDYYTLYLEKYGNNRKLLSKLNKSFKQNNMGDQKIDVSPESKNNRIQEFITSEDLDLLDSMDLWIKYYHLRYNNRDVSINSELISWIDKKLLLELESGNYQFDDFVNDFKEALKNACHETLLWIHFKSVRSVYDFRVK